MSMRLVGIGGGHIDRRGQVSGDYVPAASNPGTMREEIGGGTLNALRNAAQREVQCSLISARGGDAAGEQVAQAMARAGIADLSATFLDRTTPSYTALIDRHGDLIAGFADMDLYEVAFPRQMRRNSIREALTSHDALLCDANVPQAGLERLPALIGKKPFFAIAVSPAKVVRLRPVLSHLSLLFMNSNEAAALAGRPRGSEMRDMVQAMQEQGLRAGVITAGSDALTLFDGGEVFTLQPPAPTSIADVTGAGDALAGVTIAALLTGSTLLAAIREGVAASLMTIENPEVVTQLDPDTLFAKLALVPHASPMA